jgi:tRNA-splicing ligase RtcB/RNA 3'-terminal phosphate cyclase
MKLQMKRKRCNLAYFPEHTKHFDDYVEAVECAQDYARRTRYLMMEQIVGAVHASGEVPPFTAELKAINCDHNYVAREKHFGESVLITRKSAVREREGGTHNPAAPPFDFLARSFLPLLERTGPKVQLQFDRYGFYPAGGGRFCAEIHPAKALTGIQIGERGEITSRRATAVVVNLPRHIAQREVETVGKMLNWGPGAFSVQESRNPLGRETSS